MRPIKRFVRKVGKSALELGGKKFNHLLVLIVAAVGEGRLIFTRRSQSRLDISATPLTLVPMVPSLPWQSQRYAGWSLPVVQDDAELAAPEQAQREAVRARCGRSSSVDPNTAALLNCGTFQVLAALRAPYWTPLLPSGQQPHLPLEERDWLRPGRRSWPCCTVRFPLSSDNQLSRSTCCLRLLRANAPSRCSHPCGPSIPAPGGSAAHAQAVEPASQTPAVPAPPRRRKSAGCARRAASLHACRRTPLMIRVNCADAAAVAAPPYITGSSDCRRAPHLRVGSSPLHWRCGDSTAIATSALSKSLAVSCLQRLQPYIIVFLIDYSNLLEQAKDRHWLCSWTRPCSVILPLRQSLVT